MHLEQQGALASLLVAAVREGTLIEKDGLPRPDFADGYRIQAAVFTALGGTSPQGFKLAIRDGDLVGSSLLFVSNAESANFQPGIKVEIELAMTLGRDLPPKPGPYRREDIVDAISSVNIGVELVRSRYVGGAGDALSLLLADSMSNLGYLVGPAIPRSLLTEPADLGGLYLTNGDKVLFDSTAKHPDGDPLASVIMCANKGLPMGGYLKAGQVVTTGTLSGAPTIETASSVSVTFGGSSWSIDLK